MRCHSFSPSNSGDWEHVRNEDGNRKSMYIGAWTVGAFARYRPATADHFDRAAGPTQPGLDMAVATDGMCGKGEVRIFNSYTHGAWMQLTWSFSEERGTRRDRRAPRRDAACAE